MHENKIMLMVEKDGDGNTQLKGCFDDDLEFLSIISLLAEHYANMVDKKYGGHVMTARMALKAAVEVGIKKCKEGGEHEYRAN